MLAILTLVQLHRLIVSTFSVQIKFRWGKRRYDIAEKPISNIFWAIAKEKFLRAPGGKAILVTEDAIKVKFSD